MITDDEKQLLYLNYASLIAHELENILRDDLISVVAFGSTIWGEAGESSNIDILIVSEKFEAVSRSEVIASIEEDLKFSEEYKDLKDNNLGTNIRPLLLTQSEIENDPSLLQDIILDGFIIYDTDDFMENRLKQPRKKRKKRKQV
jgi:predicted nucleotidyltransferase